MKLLVIVGSTRPGRVGRPIADWVVDRATHHGGFDVELADLAEIDLPLFDEPVHPSLAQYQHQHTKDWSARVAGADAFVYVMPEYNHSYNAALKNAIDYLNREWAYKPVGLVSYGGVSGGLRAVQAIKPVVSALRMTPAVDAVTVPMVGSMMKDGAFEPSEIVEASAKVMLDELVKLADVLRPLRAAA
ncbi:MAG: NAD(P)H-dependent oxidoreductase [Streptomyces sp.]|uniref:NADPH-dependent FMN reductase n=1 Tax=Streptomyces sp. TaxID=1931 RepID=UPI0025F174C3|nr:NADPH-dependent FMN reductase [Streptomyces sp.]MBW8801688.1 NAD(P)H-dependent oxidoreductase [Streptomyces sp.]